MGLTFFSSFGQTFLISLFVPGFLVDFEISYSLFGTLYSFATLASAFILVWIGSKMDNVSLTAYAYFVAAGLALSTLLLAVSYWLPVLLLGLTGVRLFGQGLCGHTAHTVMARNFVAGRGKALSFANLGFSLGEALLPLVMTSVIALIGWRMGWLSASFFIILFLPAVIALTIGRTNEKKQIMVCARRVFPFFLLPLLSGILVLGIATHPFAVFLYLFMAGMTEGFGFNIKTSLYAELYGTETLGTIRSMMSMFIVISTAVSPILFGYLLDSGVSFGSIIIGAFVLAVVSIISSVFIAHR